MLVLRRPNIISMHVYVYSVHSLCTPKTEGRGGSPVAEKVRARYSHISSQKHTGMCTRVGRRVNIL